MGNFYGFIPRKDFYKSFFFHFIVDINFDHKSIVVNEIIILIELKEF